MVTQEGAAQQGREWVLLSYRIPREPSTPRIAVWRKLKDLGVAQIGDGLVGLPLDARTREHLEWVAARVAEAGGEAIVWVATPATRRDSVGLAQQMRGGASAKSTPRSPPRLPSAVTTSITAPSHGGDEHYAASIVATTSALPGRDRARLEIERLASTDRAVEVPR